MSAIPQKQKEEGIDISNMLNDVNKVLHQHLSNLLTPMLKEKQSIQQVLLNMPMVKKLQEEHLKARQAVFSTQAEAKALKTFYECQLTAKNAELIKVKEELVEALKKLDDCKNVALEVKEIPQPSKSPPLKIKNDTLRKNEKVSENSVKLATIENLHRFSKLGDSSEEGTDTNEEEDASEDDDEEDDAEVKVVKVVEEEEDEEDDEEEEEDEE